MKKGVKSWRFSNAESVTKLKTLRLFADEKSVLKKGMYFILVSLVAVSTLISCDDDDKEVPLWQEEVERLRAATTPYEFIEHAGHDGSLGLDPRVRA